MTKKGMIVSPSDVSLTPIKDQTFTSLSLSPKSRIEGLGSVTTDTGGKATATVNHGLSYVPAHLFFYRPGNRNANNAFIMDGYPWMKATLDDTAWGPMDNIVFTVNAEALVLTITIEGRASTLYEWRYFIFVEPAKS